MNDTGGTLRLYCKGNYNIIKNINVTLKIFTKTKD